MKVKEVEYLEYSVLCGNDNAEYTDLVFDTRKVTENCLFICIKGMKFDSHDVIDEIIKAGAKGIIVSHSVDISCNAKINIYKVNDSREALSLCSRAFFGYPEKKLTTVAVTGTKGKTTTACMVKKLIEHAGFDCGLIGTLGIDIGNKHTDTNNTTPESYDIQKAFADMVEAGCKYAVMEASSQAFLLSRVAGVTYDYAIFTNISSDHIGEGEHKDFQDYLDCKTQLFNQCRHGFVNADDDHAEYVITNSSCSDIKTFGTEKAADYSYSNIQFVQNAELIGLKFDADFGDTKVTCEVSIPGKFNAPNAMGALCVAHALGLEREVLSKALSKLFVNGRMELVYSTEDLKVIVDFAHNEISTINLLQTLRNYDAKRLVVVFGCGGNRSPERRYGMGRVCGEYADFSIITEDNNRMEPFESILKDIHSTFDKTGGKCIDIPLRPDAVKYAIEHHQPGDFVAIIGKGHEDYIDKEGVKTHYSDQESVRQAIKELGLK